MTIVSYLSRSFYDELWSNRIIKNLATQANSDVFSSSTLWAVVKFLDILGPYSRSIVLAARQDRLLLRMPQGCHIWSHIITFAQVVLLPSTGVREYASSRCRHISGHALEAELGFLSPTEATVKETNMPSEDKR